MEWMIKRGDKQFRVNLPNQIPDDQLFELTVDETVYQARFEKAQNAFYLKTPEGEVSLNARTCQINRFDGESEAQIEFDFYNPLETQMESFHGSAQPWVPGMENRAAAAASKGKTLRAPMTGKVLDVSIAEGDQVESGVTLLVIEAMKMENKVFAPVAGKVEQLKVSAGQAITVGDELLTIKGN